MKPDRIPHRSVVPAALTPFTTDLQVDLDEFGRHIEALASVDGVTAIMVNGASGQDTTLTRDEKVSLLKQAIEATGVSVPILGAVRESDIESDMGILANDAEAAGVDAIVIMPPGNADDATMEGALRRFNTVIENCALPVAFYQVSPQRNGYAVETMAALAKLDRVFAVKEGSGTPESSEADSRAMRAADPDIAIWSTHSRWLLGDLAMGADGLLSGMGSINADLHVTLCRAVWDSNLEEARRVNDRLWPLTQVYYRKGQNAHTRMKYALKRIGRLREDIVRPPLKPLDQAEMDRVDSILDTYE